MSTYYCSECGKNYLSRYDTVIKRVRHYRIFEYPVFLVLLIPRIKCKKCGVKKAYIPEIKKYKSTTTRYSQHIAELCKKLTIKTISELTGLDHRAIKEIDKKSIEKWNSNRNFSKIKNLGIDEISVGKGHDYFHIIHDMDRKEAIYVGEGRKTEDLDPFFERFEAILKNIKYVCMDMWKGFIKAFKAKCPNARIIFDKFHIIGHLNKALNNCRIELLQKANKERKDFFKGKKYILLRLNKNLSKPRKEILKKLLSVNRSLEKVYIFKEIFGQFWKYKYKTSANKFYEKCKEILKWNRLKSIRKFIKMIDKHKDKILNFCDVDFSLGYIEGSNNKIKTVIRQAYGFKDREYLKLKILAACSEYGRSFQPYPLKL